MRQGERVRVITECAESLAARPFARAQLVLDQFGFPTYDPFNYGQNAPEPEEYFIGQLKDSPDEQILNLHEYLAGDDAAPGSMRSADLPWNGLPVRLFLSHRHEERELVAQTKNVLNTNFGIDSFVAHADINPSKTWREVIKGALRTCHVLAAFLTPGFHDSQWCDQEIGWALGRGVPVIPIRLPGAPRFDGFAEEFQDIHFPEGGSAWQLAHNVFETVRKDPRTTDVGRQALVESFVKSYSYDRTRTAYGQLAAEPYLSSADLRRLEYAVQTNGQVYDATFGPDKIPDLVRGLVAKFEPQNPFRDLPPHF